MSVDDTICHACDVTLTADNESPVSETCDECLTHCLCYVCREARWEMAGERAAEMREMAWGECS